MSLGRTDPLMRGRRSRRRLVLAVLALSALVASTSSATAAGIDGKQAHGNDRWIVKKIRGMTLEEKVGQLFVAKVNGQSANTTDPADVAANQRDLVSALLGSGKPVVLVATRNPYDIASFPQAATYLATYSWTKPAMQAVGRILVGEVNPVARLPVRIPAADNPEATLYPFGFGLGY